MSTKKRGKPPEENNQHVNMPKKVVAKTNGQKKCLKAIDESTITIITGPAGTGKSYLSASVAARGLINNEFEKIIIVRPLSTCGTIDIGALPGDVDEKIAPYMQPLLEIFEDFFRPGELKSLIRTKQIDMRPLEFLRGTTLKNSFVILDEAQNCDYVQLHMFLTRIGEGSKYIINGDVKQSDRKVFGEENPLKKVVSRIRPGCHKTISIVELSKEDIVRHPLVGWLDNRLSDTPEPDEPVSVKNDWVAIECPGCDEPDVWFQEFDKKGRRVEQVRCWRCRCTAEIPEDVNADPWMAECVMSFAVESIKEPGDE